MKLSVMTLLLLLSAMVWADWSEPGLPFTGALQWEGEVTHQRNPWQWQIGYEGTALSLSQAANQEGRWRGLLEDVPLVLGKTDSPQPAGREGMTPQVSFGSEATEIVVTQGGPGEQTLLIPVREDRPDGVQIGTLQFRVQSLAALHATEQGGAVVAMLSGAALTAGEPGSHLTRLQRLFGRDAPAWLLHETQPVSVLPLSALTQPQLTELEAVYAVQVVAGSGELHLPGVQMPVHWRAILPVNIEFL